MSISFPDSKTLLLFGSSPSTFGGNRANRRPIFSKDVTAYGPMGWFSVRSGDTADFAIIPDGKWNHRKLWREANGGLFDFLQPSTLVTHYSLDI
jgi:hypothetical protein